jgi:glucokinase
VKILAADVGGTTIKLGIVENGHVLARDRIPALADKPMETRLEAIATSWEALLVGLTGARGDARPPGHGVVARGDARPPDFGDCSGAALALPFLIDLEQQRVMGEFGKFPGAASVDYREWARSRFGLPIAMENDLRVALLGECSAGAAKGYPDAVMIALGTGIGCAAISNGKLLRGAHNRAATLFGHTTIAFDRGLSRCGNVGCAEDLASTATVGDTVRAHPAFSSSSISKEALIDYESVFRHADRGDECSRAVLEQSLRVWSAVALNAVVAFDPAILVLGGGVMQQADRIIGVIKRHIAAHTPGMRWEIPVVASGLGDDAALVGCECLLSQALM